MNLIDEKLDEIESVFTRGGRWHLTDDERIKVYNILRDLLYPERPVT